MPEPMSPDVLLGKIRLLLGVILISAVFSAVVVIYQYAPQFPDYASNLHTVWGEFGSFVGGTLGPILSFFALLAVLSTLWLQGSQLEEGRVSADRNARISALSAQITAIGMLVQSLGEQIDQMNTALATERVNLFSTGGGSGGLLSLSR